MMASVRRLCVYILYSFKSVEHRLECFKYHVLFSSLTDMMLCREHNVKSVQMLSQYFQTVDITLAY